MKKSILTLFALALGFGAIAQVNTINQAASGANNSVTMRQYGNTETKVTQEGSNGTVLTFQSLRQSWDWVKDNTVTINQIGSRNKAETDQLGTSMSINITTAGDDNDIYINQSSNSSNASFTQSGNFNKTTFLQNGGGNTFTSTQSGNGNISELNQEVIYNSSVNLTQSGVNDKAIIRQGLNRDNFEATNGLNNFNHINATQNNNTLLLGSTLTIYQWGDANLVGVDQIGGNNTLTITQSGARNSIIGLTSNTGIQSGNNNTGILTQSGSDNTMKYSQVGNDSYVNAIQSGSGNTTRVVVGSYN
jgi:hypothetical protein